ncbi:MAG: glycosyltransferase [Clostridia bacterium]|nr:glycosyltransferase [Clostridia bacterium]
MKKLIFITLALGYGLGGSENALIQMLKKIDLSKYDITVLSLMEAPEKPFSHDGIKVIYGCEDFLHISCPFKEMIKNFKAYRLGEIWAKTRFMIASRLKKIEFSDIMWNCYSPYLKTLEEEYDVAVGYGVNLATFFAMDKVCADKKIVWVNTDLKKAHVNLKYLKKYYQKSDRIVVVAESGILRFTEIYPQFADKICVIRDILDIEEIISKSKQGEGFTDGYDGTRILSVGRLVEAKAFHLAIEAAAVLKQKKFKFKWYIIGFGGLEKELKELADKLDVKDCVIFLGQQQNPYPFFAQADFYVQTSVYEGCPITIKEAVVFNKPIISTNIPSIYEIIKDGQNGYITEMNGESIAIGVEKLLTDKDVASAMQEYQKENPLTYDEEIEKFYNIIK